LLDNHVFLTTPCSACFFEEIRELGSIDSRRLRGTFYLRAWTNRGFPDFDLNEFLAPHEVSEKEIDQLF